MGVTQFSKTAYITPVCYGSLIMLVQYVNNDIKSSNALPNVRREGCLEAGKEAAFYCSSSVLDYSHICLCWPFGLHPVVQAETTTIQKTLQQTS